MMTCYASIDSNSITCHLLLPSLSTNKPPVFGSCVLSFALWPGQPPQIEHDESMRQSGRRKKQLELASLPLLDNKNIQKHTKTKVPCKQFFIISSKVFYFKFPQLQRGGFWVLGMDDRLPPRCAIGRLGPLASMGKALIHGLKLK